MPKENTFVKSYTKRSHSRYVGKYLKSLGTLANVFFVVGLIIFSYFVVFPNLFSYLYVSSSLFFIKPFEGSVLSYTYESLNEKFTFEELAQYSSEKVLAKRDHDYDKFYITIPRLNIKDAEVEIDAESLDPIDMLGHYKGTALPGENGNAFVYGHSSLPFLYDPKDYKSIFTKLPSLDKEDKIIVKLGKKEYIYSVVIEKELLPKEVNPYSSYYPSLYHKSTITLMTCTPPGTKKYRYIVLAELISEKNI